MNERFLYEIRPVRPVVLPGVGKTIRPCSILLTKEEALTYMKYGPVYRKYTDANVPPVRINTLNIDKVHAPYNKTGVVETTTPVINDEVKEKNVVLIDVIVDKKDENVAVETEASSDESFNIPLEEEENTNDVIREAEILAEESQEVSLEEPENTNDGKDLENISEAETIVEETKEEIESVQPVTVEFDNLRVENNSNHNYEDDQKIQENNGVNANANHKETDSNNDEGKTTKNNYNLNNTNFKSNKHHKK